MSLLHEWWQLHAAVWVSWCGIDYGGETRPQAVPQGEPLCRICVAAVAARSRGRRGGRR